MYKEAYAPGLVEAFLDELTEPPSRILDVFAGVGTTLLTARSRRIDSVGVEILPYAHFVTQAKLDAHTADPAALRALGRRVLLSRCEPEWPAAVPAAEWALTGDVRSTLGTLYAAIMAEGPSVERDLALLGLLAIVGESSRAMKDGTSLRRMTSGRGPKKRDSEVTRDAVQAMFRHRLSMIANDVEGLSEPPAVGVVVLGDARNLPTEVLAEKADAAMFSPPYPNRYDYSAIYQLELAYGFIEDNVALKDLRRSMLRSHLEAPAPLERTVVQPALDEFLCALLSRKRPGDQTGRTFRMVSGYFEDMHRVLQELTLVLRPGSPVAIVVGSQCFAGQHLPTDLLLSAMAEEIGMTTMDVWVIRNKGIAVQQRTRWGDGATRESVVRLIV
jgi:hypothetical protein